MGNLLLKCLQLMREIHSFIKDENTMTREVEEILVTLLNLSS